MSFYDEYKMVERIEKGGGGVVKKCINITTQEEYAVKVCKFGGEGCEFTKLHHESLRELAALQLGRGHPHIVQLVDFYVENDGIYFVMELALNDVMDLEFFPGEKKYCIYALLRGIEYLHSLNIMNRDIKLDNILNFGDNIFKVCDFGYCGKDSDPFIRQTTCWRAPEIIYEEKYDNKIDCWSVGIIMHDIQNNELTFNVHGDKKLLSKIKKFRIDADEPYYGMIKSLTHMNSRDRATIQEILALNWWNDIRTPEFKFKPPIQLQYIQKSYFKEKAKKILKKYSETRSEKIVSLYYWFCSVFCKSEVSFGLETYEEDELEYVFLACLILSLKLSVKEEDMILKKEYSKNDEKIILKYEKKLLKYLWLWGFVETI